MPFPFCTYKLVGSLPCSKLAQHCPHPGHTITAKRSHCVCKAGRRVADQRKQRLQERRIVIAVWNDQVVSFHKEWDKLQVKGAGCGQDGKSGICRPTFDRSRHGEMGVFRALVSLDLPGVEPPSLKLVVQQHPRAGTALAASGMTVLVAPVVGPLLGGWITDNISWPWIFYINIPVGLLSALLIWSVHGSRESAHGPAPLDYAGLALLVIWVGSLQLMFDLGKELDWFESMAIVGLGLIALTGFLFFLAWELTERHPVVDLGLFRGRSFLFGTVALSIAFGLFFGNAVILPIWLQQHMGFSAVWAGASIAPMGVVAILLSPWVGRMIGRIDPRVLSTVSFSMYAAALWMRSHFTTDVDIVTILVPTLLQGVATAFFFIPLQSIIYAGLPLSRRPAAAGLSTFLRVSAGAFGTSAGTTLWEHRATMHHAHLVEQMAAGHSEGLRFADSLREAGLAGTQVAAYIDRVIDRQAYTMAATDIFHLSALIFVLLLLPLWCAGPPRQASPAGPTPLAGATRATAPAR